VLAWLAQEAWVLKVYESGLNLYKQMAAAVFSIEDAESISKDCNEYKIGKNLVLGCGYGLGGAKFVAYSEKAGVEITEAFAKAAVKSYRVKHKKIVQFWYDVERCAIAAVRERRSYENAVVLRNLKFYVDQQWFCIKLPNGRALRYYRPRVVPVEKFGEPALQLQFKTEFRGRLVSESTYGGKLVENIVQATARDILVSGMFEAESHGYRVLGTVHDELLTEQFVEEGSVEELEKIVCKLPPWATGLPLSAEGFESYRYRK
jgi:DNA polymerase